MSRKTVVRSFSIPPALLAQFEKAADEESRTYSELVREAIRHYLKKRAEEKAAMDALRRQATGKK